MTARRAPRRHRRLTLAGVTGALLLGAVGAAPAAAQQSAAPVPGPAVGDPAPDFALVGVTRYGILRDSVRLADFRGQTVVLAFFYKARTKG
jgi:thioredoxin-dependent peroxiredoxin